MSQVVTMTPSGAITLINTFLYRCHAGARAKGFWDKPRHEGEAMMLVITELAELVEALRHAEQPSEHIPEFSAAEEEAADAFIRLMDAAVGFDLPLHSIVSGACSAAQEYWRTPVVNAAAELMRRVVTHTILVDGHLMADEREYAGDCTGAAVAGLTSVCSEMGWRLMPAIEAKLAYNAGRPTLHGKGF